MTHETLVLAMEIGGLVAVLGLGMWAVLRRTAAKRDTTPTYDMRRDGQRIGV